MSRNQKFWQQMMQEKVSLQQHTCENAQLIKKQLSIKYV